MQIEELDLDVRTYNAVKRTGCDTVEELRQMLAEDPDNVRRNLGSRTFDRITEMLAETAETEEKNMIEITTKCPPAPAEPTTPEYLAAFNLNARIHYCKDSVERGLAEMCIGIEQMRDGKQYKVLGYSNFEEYCQTEFGFSRMNGVRYADIGKMLNGQNVTSMLQNADSLGMTKLSLLAKLDEPTREVLTESIDVENATVKELKAQISALQRDKDKLETETADLGQKLDAAEETIGRKDKQIKEARESGEKSLDECKNYLNGKIRELENRIYEMENAPIDHDMTDEDAAEEIKRLKRELEDEQLRVIMLEKSGEAKARNAADAVRDEQERKRMEMERRHEEELQKLREGYEKQLAEAGAGADEDELDEARFNSFRLIFEELVDKLENLLEDMKDDPRIDYIKRLDDYWTKNLLYLKRAGAGA